MKSLLVLLLLVISVEAQAARFVKFKYKVKPNEDFADILKNFTKDSAIINRNAPTVEKIIANNKQVSDWSALEAGQEFDLYVEEESFDYSKFDLYMDESTKALEKIAQSKSFAEHFYAQGYKAYMYAMISVGNLSQSKSDLAEIKFKQTSPFTLGFNNAYFFKHSKWAIHGGGFYSSMRASLENLNNSKIDVPGEFGVNAYGEYRSDRLNLSFFSGLEYENFHSFNLNELATNQRVLVDDSNFVYFSVGISKYFKIYDHDFIARLMFSKSIASSYTTESTLGAVKEFDANKFMLYLNYKLSERFFFNSVIKYQTLSGNSEMDSLRLGIGVGYAFF